MRETTQQKSSTKQPCLYFETENQTNSSELDRGNGSRNMIVCMLYQVKRRPGDVSKNENENKAMREIGEESETKGYVQNKNEKEEKREVV